MVILQSHYNILYYINFHLNAITHCYINNFEKFKDIYDLPNVVKDIQKLFEMPTKKKIKTINISLVTSIQNMHLLVIFIQNINKSNNKKYPWIRLFFKKGKSQTTTESWW